MLGDPMDKLVCDECGTSFNCGARPANRVAGAWICQIYVAVLTLLAVVCAPIA